MRLFLRHNRYDRHMVSIVVVSEEGVYQQERDGMVYTLNHNDISALEETLVEELI